MIISKRLNDVDVMYGNELDVCNYCLNEELRKSETKNIDEIRRNMRGRLSGHKLYKLTGYKEVCICKHHLEKILEEVNKIDA